MSDPKYKILMVHNYYQHPGGEDIVVANEKKLLEDHGHEVILYSRDNAELKSFSKLKSLLLPFIAVFNIRTYRDVREIIKAQRIDIVHVHNTLVLVSPSVYYAAFRMKVPVVQTIHNFRLLCPNATLYREGHICEDCIRHGLWQAVKYRCYRDSHPQTLTSVLTLKIHRMIGTYGRLHYICLTAFNRNKLLTLHQIKPDCVHIVPNFACNHAEIIPTEQRENKMVFVGRLDKLKGIDILFSAWKLLGNDAPQLVVYGTGPMKDWCERYIQNNQLATIEMRGHVPNQEALQGIAAAKALILPTQCYEGFPMTIAESLAAGTPVLGSDIGNVGSLIDENCGRTFQHNSDYSIAEAVKAFSKNPFSPPIQNTSEQHYAQLLTVYKHVIQFC